MRGAAADACGDRGVAHGHFCGGGYPAGVGKNWERGHLRSETFANQVVQTTLGLPTALFNDAHMKIKVPVPGAQLAGTLEARQ